MKINNTKTFNLCSKCCHENINIEYCNGTTRLAGNVCNVEGGEHLHKKCLKCGYIWCERCTDYI